MFCLYFLCLYVVSIQSQSIINIDKLMVDFLLKEENLWQNIDSNKTQNETVKEIFGFYEYYFSKNFEEIGIFQIISNESLSDYNNILEHLVTVNNTFEHTLQLIKNNSYEEILQYAKEIRKMRLFRSSTYYLIYDYSMKTDFWSSIKNTSRFCGKGAKVILSEKQVLHEVYKEFFINLLKSYILSQFSNIIRAFSVEKIGLSYSLVDRKLFMKDIDNFQEESTYRIKVQNSSREMWSCDPENFVYNGTNSYVEIPISYQGFIANEINLNSEGNCRQTCQDYTNTMQYNCNEKTYCSTSYLKKNSFCHGSLENCVTMPDDITICEAPLNSSRRYDFIKYEDGNVIGIEKLCPNNIHVQSHLDWFYRCDTCLCYCKEEGSQDTTSDSNIYFDLRDVTSDITKNNIVTGVGITKVNNVIQFKLLQHQLLPNGVLNTTDNSNWITSAPFNITDKNAKENQEYTAITWENRSIALTSATIGDDEHVVTGVRFHHHDNHIGIEIRATRLNFETGLLVELENSFWIENPNILNELELHKPDVPTKSLEKSQAFAEKNEFIKFQPTDFDKDGAQTTVPYLDTSTVESYLPLSGVGLYYKSTMGYGGFIAAKLIVHNF